MIDSISGLQNNLGVSVTQSSRTDKASFSVKNNEKTCPYSHLAKDDVISYNGVTFMCDYKHNAITLGDVESDPKKVLTISMAGGGCLKVNVDNLGDLSRAAGMFSPTDLNAILRAIQIYKHCTSKLDEIEDEKNKSPEETVQADYAAKERNKAAEQMKSGNESIYQKLMSKDAIAEMNEEDLEYEEKTISAEEFERRLELLFEDWDEGKDKINN